MYLVCAAFRDNVLPLTRQNGELENEKHEIGGNDLSGVDQVTATPI